MRETAVLRFNDHQEINGIKEFSLEFAIPGRFERTIIGASQVEITNQLIDAFEQVFGILGIPQTVERTLRELSEPIQTIEQFTAADGTPVPVSGFAATAKAHFNAQIIRNGKVVEDDNEAPNTNE